MKKSFKPRVEILEDRCVPTGVDTWFPIGPAQQQVPTPYFPNTTEAISGRVSALAFGQVSGQQALFVGTASGGVWRSTEFSSDTPHWTSLTDSIGVPVTADGVGSGANDIGSIATSGSTIVVGTGEANYSADSRYGSGILQSVNGGNTWLALSTGGATNPFFGKSISKVLIDPASSATIYAAVVPYDRQPADANCGVWRSTDGGSTGRQITGLKSDGRTSSGLASGLIITDLEYTGSGASFRL